MNTNRTEGILVIEISSYKAALSGKMVERNKIVMKDITTEAEGAACDLEQLVLSSVRALSQELPENKNGTPEPEDDYNFYDDETPSLEEVEKQAEQLKTMVAMQDRIPASKFLKVFEGIKKANLVRIEGDIKMQDIVWDKVKWKDKEKIIFSYIVFFVNPLQSAQKQSTTPNSTHTIAGDIKE